MTIRSRKGDDDHNRLVHAMANELTGKGFYVKADHIGHGNGRPNMYNNHIPDVEAISVAKKILVEAETQESIDSSDTREQFIAFSNVGGAEFHVIVPKGYIPAMQNQAREWSVKVDNYWEMNL